jgi:hypothetical protein
MKASIAILALLGVISAANLEHKHHQSIKNKMRSQLNKHNNRKSVAIPDNNFVMSADTSVQDVAQKSWSEYF